MVMRKLWFCLALALAASGRAFAVIGTIDDVPAATLLLPYFEVDVARPDGVNTLFSINNAAAAAVLAHVTIWTDQSVPALAFDVYLTGYDKQTVNLRDVLVDGELPQTASAGQDPKDAISPHGAASQDVSFASCTSLPYAKPAVSATVRSHLQAWLQGMKSPTSGTCGGSRHGDGILRGYATVDTVSSCNLFFPSDWTSYAPLLTKQNVLWGDSIYLNPGEGFADGETLVAIEACATCFAPGDHTFYGRYNGASAADGREALPTTMAARYVNGGVFKGGTGLLVWREADSAASGYNCYFKGPPSWYPLDAFQIAIFDEDEQPVISPTCPSSSRCGEPVLIANAAQRVDVSNDLLTPFDFGWVYLKLQHPGTAYNDPYAQMWLVARMLANGRFSVGMNGVALDNANAPITTAIPIP